MSARAVTAVGRATWRAPLAGLMLLAGLGGAVAAPPLPSEMGREPVVEKLASPPSKHWVWVNDFVFPHIADGQALLVDGDSGRFLGMLSTGTSFTRVVLPRDGKVIYAPETYFSRGTRGTRTDLVTIYDGATLNVLDEIVVPAKRSSNMPVMGNAVLTDDDRFLLIYNFNPGQSVTVVDTASRKFAGEIETPGCGLIYPTGPRSFFSQCANGGLLAITLDDNGASVHQARMAPFFDVQGDPLTEKPVRLGDTWYFVSYDGHIHTVNHGPNGLAPGADWWLTTPAERKQGWRPGGLQQLAVHAGQNRLYAIMHQGNRDSHKDPGQSIWVYDLATRKRVQRITTQRLSGSIQLTSDARPLLFSIFMGSNILDVYDPASGKLLRSIGEIGTTPTLLVTP
ncbi:MAG: amine dehydrogenase large subunit [Steroidobacteraceae bacterium]